MKKICGIDGGVCGWKESCNGAEPEIIVYRKR